MSQTRLVRRIPLPGRGACHSLRSTWRLGLLALTALLAVASAAASEGAPASAAEIAALRARAEADIAALYDALPAGQRPSVEFARAYRDLYVEVMTREIEPCPGPEGAASLRHPSRGSAASLRNPPLPGSAFVVPDTDTVATWGRVFLDENENGVLDDGELGMENIQVSNGRGADGILPFGVALTLADGSFSFLTPLEDSRFVHFTVPSGYTATTPFFHRIAATSPDTAYFGLRETPETADPVFRWVQISDMQVTADPASGVELSDDLAEIEALPEPPDFIVVTGDLVNTGSIDEQYQVFLSGIQGHTITLHTGYGDHDASDPPLRVANFEQYIGPTYYSFDHGGVHFVMYNDIDAANVAGEFIQQVWLALDLVTARARDPNHDPPIVICKHTMPLADEINLYEEYRVVGAFSGHWHGSRVRLLEGIFDVNTPPIRYAGIDKSSRGFRINDMNGGTVVTEYRLAGIRELIRFVRPANGDSVAVGQIQVRVNAYDSVAPFISGVFWADGPTSTNDLPLTADGPWAWTGLWDASGAPEGTYTISAFLTPEVGTPLIRSIDVEVVRAGPIFPAPHTDWPCYKLDAAGTGYTPDTLEPPLRVAWAQHLGGRNNVASPAVAAGRVYIGTSNIATVEQAALSCFDAVSGELLWRFPARTDVKSTPSIADGRVFFSNSIGTVFALDAVGGDFLWSTQLGDSLTRWEMTSPTVVGDTVYAGGLPAMSALDANDGGVLWQQAGETGPTADFVPSIYSAPAVSGDMAVYTTRAGIFAFDRHTGAPAWEHPGRSQQHRSAAISGSLVYSAGGYFGSQKNVAYDLQSGQMVYQGIYSVSEATSGVAITPTRVVSVFGGNQPDFPNAFMQGWDLQLGNGLIWNFEVDVPISCSRPYERTTGSINSTPAVTGNIVYFGADDGHLYAVDLDTGSEIWQHDLGVPVRSSPAIAGNMLFITGEDGTLYAFISGPMATTGARASGASLVPLTTALLGGLPNPFNPTTTIAFTLGPRTAGPKPVSLRIYDVSGRLVRTLIDSPLAPGHHTATWDGRDDHASPLASGVYHYTLSAGAETFHDRLVMLK